MRSTHDSILRRLRSLAGALAVTALAVAGASCNDNPTTVGSEYLPENVQFHRIVLQPEQVTSDVAAIANGSSAGAVTFLVGRASDGTVAHSLLAISATSSLVQENRTPTGAELLLTPRSYRYPASGGAGASFDVVVLDGVFNESAKWDPTLVSQIESAPSLGTFQVTTTDTTRPLAVTLDPAQTNKFLHEYFRYDTVTTTTNGTTSTVVQTRILKTLALRATSESGTIVSFVGSTFRDVADSLKPGLSVHYADTTVVLRGGVSNWIANAPDQYGDGKIRLIGGLPVRTFLKFNIDSIPASATVHQTELRLSLDPALSPAGSFGSSTFLVAYAADQNTLNAANRMISGYSGLFTGNRTALDSTSFTNTFRITSLSSLITNWLRYKRGLGGIPNDGMILALNRSTLRTDLETGSVDRLAFHGTDAADSALRPTLTIIYSVQTDAKK